MLREVELPEFSAVNPPAAVNIPDAFIAFRLVEPFTLKLLFSVVLPEAVNAPTTPNDPVVVDPLTVRVGMERLPIVKAPETVKFCTFIEP
jgi:hypothetical protein